MTSVGRRIGIAGLAALIGGVLVLGVGGRLAMRLSGAMAIAVDPDIRFRLTADGFRVGTITLEGSIGLVIFGGVFGSIVAGGFWALLKDWLPERRQLLWAGLAAAGIGGNILVHPDNIDFIILKPVAANVVLYPLLTGVAGVAIVTIDRWLTERLPSGATTNWVLTTFALIGGALVALLAIGAAGDGPAMSAGLVVLGSMAVPMWVAEARGRSPNDWLVRRGALVAGSVVTFQWLLLLASAAEILA